MSRSPASATIVAQLVEIMRALAGPHPGFRPFTPRESSARVPFTPHQQREG